MGSCFSITPSSPPTSTDSLQPAANRTKEDKVLHQGTDRVAGRFSPGTSGGRSLRLGSKEHPVLCGCTATTRGAALAQLVPGCPCGTPCRVESGQTALALSRSAGARRGLGSAPDAISHLRLC